MRISMLLLACSLVASGCALTNTASNFNGLQTVDGGTPTHINMTKYALHLLVAFPLIGDASLEGAVEDFTEEARKTGATRVRIVQSDQTRLWWILPPLSFIVTPAWTNVAGDAIRG